MSMNADDMFSSLGIGAETELRQRNVSGHPQQQYQQQQIGHLMPNAGKGGAWPLYAPIPGDASSSETAWVYLGHFLLVFVATLVVLTGSLLLASVQDVPGTGSTLGIQMVTTGVFHALLIYFPYRMAQPFGMLLHINPLISIIEWMPHGTYGFFTLLVELVAQGGGAVAAAAIAWAVLGSGTMPATVFTTAISPILDTTRMSVGALIAIETMATFAFGIALWHNYTHEIVDVKQKYRLGRYAQPRDLPAILAAVTGITTAFAFPWGGVTMHQPLRFLTGCVISPTAGACSATGAWVYLAAGAFGLVAAALLHLATQRLNGNSLKYRYAQA